MSRMLFYLVPLLLPFAAYGAYVWLAQKMGQSELSWRHAPWAWLIVTGLVLMIASFFALGLSGSSPPGGTYVPPHMENGKLVPGQVKR